MTSHATGDPARAGRNLELKARVTDLDAARRTAESIGAVRQGAERQIDRYFAVPTGRLKLRQSSLDGAHLIAYERPDESGFREARFHRLPVSDPEGLAETLQAMLGAAGRVEKERDVWWWNDVRIHLDRVDRLGSFVEFEARLDRIGDAAEARRRLDRLRRDFRIADDDVIGGSYGEMS